jgi:competence ComEA-like helix-hairpin-helix protein
VSPLSDGERRALAILAALLLLATAARWIDRPQSILNDVPEIDVAALAAASDSAKQATSAKATRARSTNTATKPAAATSPTTPIDLNRATAVELEAISGVGPALAARLIARRDSLRAFRSYDDVDAVRGIGPAMLEKIRSATVIR